MGPFNSAGAPSTRMRCGSAFDRCPHSFSVSAHRWHVRCAVAARQATLGVCVRVMQALLTAKWPEALQYHEKSCIRCFDMEEVGMSSTQRSVSYCPGERSSCHVRLEMYRYTCQALAQVCGKAVEGLASCTGFWTDTLVLCTAVEEAPSVQRHISFHMERAASGDASATEAQEPSTANFVRLHEVCCVLCIAYADACAVGGEREVCTQRNTCWWCNGPFACQPPANSD